MITTGSEGVAIFGFMSGFFTLVLLGYRRELRTPLPVIAVGMACCAVYGFLAGVWPVGFVLVALTASEARRWWIGRGQVPSMATGTVVQPGRFASESRIHRMFGQT